MKTMTAQHEATKHTATQHDRMKHGNPYVRLAAMTGLSFVAMYILMYAMVDVFANVFASVNQVYMAALMTAPMVVFELALMGSMYPNRRANVALIAVACIALAVCWALIRNQTAVNNTQFLRSMIPHHAGAILMCQEAAISDPQITRLCQQIIKGQQEEIDEMKARLQALNQRP